MVPLEVAANLTWVAPYIGAVLTLLLWRVGRWKDYLAVASLLLAAVSSSLLLYGVLQSPEGVLHYSQPWVPSLGVTVGVYADTLSAFMSLIVSWLCFFIGFYSIKYMEGDSGLPRYWFFFTFFTGSMLLLVLADNLLLMFIGWEGTGLASYALIGHWYRDEEKRYVGDPGRKAWGTSMFFSPSHSGVRAIAFTRLGDVGLIVGIIVLYTLTGTLSIPEIASKAHEWGGMLAARGLLIPFLLLFSLGALAKSAQFPFHEWLVTAMTGPTSVSALIHAATMVKAGVYFMLRFAPIFYLISAVANVQDFFTIIAYIGAFTAFFMASQAIAARELKLILAFSTASQLGLMFLGIGAAGLVTDFSEGFIASFNHLMSHAIFKASLFLAAGAVIHTAESKYLDDMGGLSKYMKVTFASMLLAALSLSGFPPMMGFWTKDSLLEVVYLSGLYVPFILAIVTTSFTAFYSMKLILRTFLTPPSKNIVHLSEEHSVHEAHPVMWVPYALLAIISLGAGVAWFFTAGSLNTAITRNVLGLEEAHIVREVQLDPIITTLSVSMVAVGIGLAVAAYRGPVYSKVLGTMMTVKPGLRSLYNFLYDRWYVNAIYYRMILGGAAWLSRNIFKWFDTFIIDNLYHLVIPWLTMAASKSAFKTVETDGLDRGYNRSTVGVVVFFSNVFRRLQTGRVNHYLLTFLTGLTLIIVILFARLV